jgi:hypothetical protein
MVGGCFGSWLCWLACASRSCLLPHVPHASGHTCLGFHVPPPARASDCTCFVSQVDRLACASRTCLLHASILPHVYPSPVKETAMLPVKTWRADQIMRKGRLGGGEGSRLMACSCGGISAGQVTAFEYVPADASWWGRLPPCFLHPPTSLHPRRPHPQPPYSCERLGKYAFG